jgi:hypothetical protein
MEIPEGYSSHAEKIAEELRDDLRGRMRMHMEDEDAIEAMLDDITNAIFEAQKAGESK